MAKSTRSKAKRSFRRDKREREDSVFFINDAARLARLSAKLRSKFADGAVAGSDAAAGPADGELASGEPQTEEGISEAEGAGDSIVVDAEAPAKISTHGPRSSRRASWRLSKGMSARPKRADTLNKQGTVPGRRKPGRSHRRR
ncbi:hypothetical protein BS47DRAFT_1341130 [Hydnum rufescens UP504]|uniref:DUF2423 domain-containing protein n=1 Tax=Hydnum rufescens UP504 TaxID=1448309 RepID=A0A9P6DZP5_9AGAM|nr:hypothetical protein BS47DRAFT_1341130 [Hydnum rufescens UP504]